MSNNRKTGPVTLAIGLIFFGSIMLISNVAGIGILDSSLKLWPLLLIGLGLEYFIKSFIYRKSDEKDGHARFHFPTVIVVLLLTGVLFTGQQVVSLLHNNNLKDAITEAITGSNFSYKNEVESKSIDVKPGLTNININDTSGNIVLIPSMDEKLHVKTSAVAWGPSQKIAEKRAKSIKAEINEGEVIGIACERGDNHNNRRSADITLTVSIPKGVYINIDNSMGNIRADNLEVNLDIKNITGNVTLNKINGYTKLAGDSGQVYADNLNGNLDIEMTNGEMRINDVSGDIRARNETGRIEVTSTHPVLANYNISNRTGEIVCRIPAASNAILSANTKQGSISGSINLKIDKASASEQGTEAKGSLILGAGKGTINLYNETGSIIVDKN